MIPDLSIIIPIYRNENYLERCIISARKQSLKNTEIILVDEGEADKSYEIMRNQAKEDERIRIIHGKHGGYGAACNAAIKTAKGKFLAVLEADDYALPYFYQDLYAFALKNETEIVKAPYFEKKGANMELCNFAQRVSSLLANKIFNIRSCPVLLAFHASIWSGIYKRKFLLDNGLFFRELPGAGYVDNEFRVKTFLRAERIGWVAHAGYVYSLDNENSSTSNFDINRMALNWLEIHNTIKKLSASERKNILPSLLVDEFYSVLLPYLRTGNISPDTEIAVRQIIDDIKIESIPWMPLPFFKKIKIGLIICALKNNHPFGLIKRLAQILDTAKRNKRVHIKCV